MIISLPRVVSDQIVEFCEMMMNNGGSFKISLALCLY